MFSCTNSSYQIQINEKCVECVKCFVLFTITIITIISCLVVVPVVVGVSGVSGVSVAVNRNGGNGVLEVMLLLLLLLLLQLMMMTMVELLLLFVVVYSICVVWPGFSFCIFQHQHFQCVCMCVFPFFALNFLLCDDIFLFISHVFICEYYNPYEFGVNIKQQFPKVKSYIFSWCGMIYVTIFKCLHYILVERNDCVIGHGGMEAWRHGEMLNESNCHIEYVE